MSATSFPRTARRGTSSFGLRLHPDALSANMLAGAIAALFTGYYDLVFVPVAVPELLVRAMLPAEWGNADDAFLSADELQQATQVHLPDPGQGKRWVCVEAGKQVDTGVNYVPMGKSSFFVSAIPGRALPVRHTLTLFFTARRKPKSRSPSSGIRSSSRPFRSPSRRSCCSRPASCRSRRTT